MKADGELERRPTHEPSSSAGRTLTVLEALVADQGGLTLTALARKSGVPLATCASIVYTFEQRGYAARTVVGRSHFWRPTLGLYRLAAKLVRDSDLTAIAVAEMQELALELGMPVHIGVLDGASIAYVAKAAHPGFIQFNTYVGKAAPFNLTALGRAIAAYLPDDELAVLLRRLATGSGPRALPMDRESVLELLEKVRKRGYAVESEEEQDDIACVAMPVFDASRHVAAAVGVTGFAKDLRGPALKKAVAGLESLSQLISARLGYLVH